MIPLPPFTCEVIRVHDGDGPLWCRSGEKVRVAGIQAPDFESAEPCRRPDARRANYTCDDRAAQRSQRIVLGKRLTCQPQGKSYSRVVARCTLPDGRSLSCAVIAAGAAVRWDRYWLQYRMGECRRY
jgi:endonuclease YncB( thermonuclease family)